MANFESIKRYPLWFRTTIKMLAVVLVYIILFYGRFILMPLAISGLLAMILQPLCQQLERLKIGRITSIVLSMTILFLIISGILFLLSVQLIKFTDQLPEAGARLKVVSNQLLGFFQHSFHISPEQQIDFFQQSLQKMINRSGQYLSTILGTTTNIFTTVALLPFFVYFMLYYKDMYRNFIHHLWAEEDEVAVESVLTGIQSVARNYIVGLIIVITILASLNSLGLWLIGMDHVLFFAIFASTLAIIPYIGIVIGSLPAIIYALLFFDSLWMPIGVMAIFFSVQFMEGNFITPNIVGSRVSINPFMALIALVVGEQVWGIVGMIVFVPLVGVLKCIFDEVRGLEPYGYLLGNTTDYQQSRRENSSTNG